MFSSSIGLMRDAAVDDKTGASVDDKVWVSVDSETLLASVVDDGGKLDEEVEEVVGISV